MFDLICAFLAFFIGSLILMPFMPLIAIGLTAYNAMTPPPAESVV